MRWHTIPGDEAPCYTGVDVPKGETPLDTWKAIAGHLGKSVRTVQLWEKTLGLPVHRLGGSRVHAYVSELDEWRRNNSSAPGRAKVAVARLRITSLTVFSALALASGGAAIILLNKRQAVEKLETAKNQSSALLVYDASVRLQDELATLTTTDGALQWTIPAERLRVELIRQVSQGLSDRVTAERDRPFLVYRLTANSGRLLAVDPPEGQESSDVLRCYDVDENEMWSFEYGRSIDFQGRIDSSYQGAVHAIVRSRNKDFVLVSAFERIYFETQIALLDPENGKLVDEFWHPGRFRSWLPLDLDGDGIDELVFGGINNPGRGVGHGAIWVLKVPFSEAGVTDNELLGIENVAKPWKYRLFARPDMFVATARKPIIWRMELRPGDRRLKVFLGEKPYQVIHDFDLRLEPTASALQDQLRQWHSRLQDDKVLEHSLTSEEEILWKKSRAFDRPPDGNDPDIARSFGLVPE